MKPPKYPFDFLPNFAPALASIAYWLVANESFFHTFEAAGIDVSEWPNEMPRDMVEKYLAMRATNGHAYAAFQLAIPAERIAPRVLSDFAWDDANFVRGICYDEIEKHKRRSLAKALELDPNNVKEIAESILRISQTQSKLISFADLASQISKELEASNNQITKPITIPRFEFLSKMIGGFNPGRVSVLMADTGFGKTNLGIQLSVAMVEVRPTIYMNMEMIPRDFGIRVGVALTGKEQHQVTHEDMSRAKTLCNGDSLFISDGRDEGISVIRGHVKTLKKSHGLGFLVIDYDQKLKLHLERNQQEWQALQQAMVNIESIAKEHEIHVLVLAQTNEEGKISGSRRSMFPASSVLRFHTREDGLTVIEAMKNRFGRTGATLEVNYRPSICQISELQFVDQIRRRIL